MKNTIKETEGLFDISVKDMKKIIIDFHKDMARGLCGKKSSLKMLPAYVDRPKGDERGTFIALDLGGTNFRVLDLELKGRRKSSTPVSDKFTLKKEHIAGEGRKLFDFIAGSIKSFIHKHGLASRRDLHIGFTFSFPVLQASIASGRLVRWTKGFKARGVEGKDVVRLLNDALVRKGIRNAKVVALANDTVGTLIARSYEDPNCDVGVILGTGTNACYREKISNIKKWKQKNTPLDKMIVNIEWGNFNKIHRTYYDRKLDAVSENPGEQLLEKMVSGMYLCEITRLVLNGLINERHVFKRGAFKMPDTFSTADMSLIESDCSKGLSKINSLLEGKFGIKDSDHVDRKALREICNIVSTRAARISAAAIIAVVTKMDPLLLKKHTVAVDGTVYEKYSGFSKKIKTVLNGYLNKKAQNIVLTLAKDGSGKGAAIIAAVAL